MKTLVACILNQMLKKQNRSLAVMELISYHVKEGLQKIRICPFDYFFLIGLDVEILSQRCFDFKEVDLSDSYVAVFLTVRREKRWLVRNCCQAHYL